MVILRYIIYGLLLSWGLVWAVMPLAQAGTVHEDAYKYTNDIKGLLVECNKAIKANASNCEEVSWWLYKRMRLGHYSNLRMVSIRRTVNRRYDGHRVVTYTNVWGDLCVITIIKRKDKEGQPYWITDVFKTSKTIDQVADELLPEWKVMFEVTTSGDRLLTIKKGAKSGKYL